MVLVENMSVSGFKKGFQKRVSKKGFKKNFQQSERLMETPVAGLSG